MGFFGPKGGVDMTSILKFSAIALLAFLFVVPAASAHPRVFVGGGYVAGPAWGWYGPGWYGWYGPGWGWYEPYWWGYPYAYGPVPNAGQVKFVDVPKDSLVYVDGGYAGTVGKLKRFPLKPGNHDIELRDPSGHRFHQERVHVLAGKTLEIHGSLGGR